MLEILFPRGSILKGVSQEASTYRKKIAEIVVSGNFNLITRHHKYLHVKKAFTVCYL